MPVSQAAQVERKVPDEEAEFSFRDSRTAAITIQPLHV